jgi:hypothetical protein
VRKAVKIDDTWIHLRVCLISGHVGCCKSLKNKHFRATDHSIIEPGEDWRWCYGDQTCPYASGAMLA